jgi:6-phosphogluconolactonase
VHSQRHVEGELVAKGEIRIVRDAGTIAAKAAEEIVRIATDAAAKTSRFTIALAGGSTPKTLYNLLVTDARLRAAIPWDKMLVFFGDERHVAPDQADSNYKMAWDTMLSKAPLKPEQIFRMKGEYPHTDKAAQEYEGEIRKAFQLKDGQFPRFDLIFIGMGNEGHALSLFPGTKALHETKRIVTHNWVGKLYTERITLTAPTANAAANVIFMVAGADKALAAKGVLEGPHEPEQLPSQMIQPTNGKLLWLMDTAAGSLLTSATRE